MNPERLHIVRKVGVNLCRFLLAAVFIFSGFVKAVDPLGSFYKLQDYLAAWNIVNWFPGFLVLLFGIVLSAVEFCVGVFLFLGIHRRFSSVVAFLLMCVMTPLTLYLALFNPVSDCGCFGDAVVLTNWQTFSKNVILLVLGFVLFRKYKEIVRFISRKIEWMVTIYTVLLLFVLAFYCLRYLPVLDFRPYRVGVNVAEAMTIPDGAKPDVFETYFVWEKEGRRETLTADEMPDSTWTFVERHTVLKEKGYEPPVHDLFMQDFDTGEDFTDRILARPGYVFLLVAHHLEEADDSNVDLINEIYDYCMEYGYGFYALTASSPEQVALWRERTGAEYPFLQSEGLTLKTIIRSNPGLLLMKDGTILNKWSHFRLPDEYVLTDSLDKLELGRMRPGSDLRTIGYVLLWFIVPLLLVLGVDLLLIRRRDKRASQGSVLEKEEELTL
ncbi:MAG: DoxX family protein [Prevotellaceae bacterium]|nr:DoxX family protein [Prevotellaceae bacterium]